MKNNFFVLLVLLFSSTNSVANKQYEDEILYDNDAAIEVLRTGLKMLWKGFRRDNKSIATFLPDENLSYKSPTGKYKYQLKIKTNESKIVFGYEF